MKYLNLVLIKDKNAELEKKPDFYSKLKIMRKFFISKSFVTKNHCSK